ncbi:hypothetical protein BGX30_007023, partial [Mortierella sp. GBA39]
RIFGQGLQQHATDSQASADEGGDQRARHANVPDDNVLIASIKRSKGFDNFPPIGAVHAKEDARSNT